MNRCLSYCLNNSVELCIKKRPKIKLYKPYFQRSNYNCWSCKKNLDELEARSQFCPCHKNVILPLNNKVNYFDIFNIDKQYRIDSTELTKTFRQKMRKLHPDLFTMKSDVIIF